MPKFAYLFGVVLLWLVAGCGAIWWTLTVFALYETLWAVLTSLLVVTPLLFFAHILHRAWRWTWTWSNSAETTSRSPSSNTAPTGAPPPDLESGHGWWHGHSKSE